MLSCATTLQCHVRSVSDRRGPPAVSGLIDAWKRISQEAAQPTGTSWWKKGDAVMDLQSRAHWLAEINEGDRLVVVDWFRPSCQGCEASFAALYQAADDEDLKRAFKFAKCNLEVPELKELSQEEGITMLPSLSVYSPRSKGQRLITMPVPVSRIKFLKLNLSVIMLNTGCERYVLDPNGFVVPVAHDMSTSQQAAQVQAAAAPVTSAPCDDESCSSLEW